MSNEVQDPARATNGQAVEGGNPPQATGHVAHPPRGGDTRVRVIREGVASYLPDIDPEETSEWLESFDDLLDRSGAGR
ncbi:MAG: hypothetical protein L0H59_14280, partial [Tomitella sp.]|nr:hypothetical protein [Tomitella sp.]